VAFATIILRQRDSKFRDVCDRANRSLRLAEPEVLDVFVGEAGSINAIISAAAEGEDALRNETHSDRLGHLRTMFQYLTENRPPIQRDVSRQADEEIYFVTTVAPMLESAVSEDVGDACDVGVTTGHIRSDGHATNEEHQVHRIEVDMPGLGTKAERKIRRLQNFRRRGVVLDSIKRQLAIPTQYGAFTDFEVAQILSCAQTFQNGHRHESWREHLTLVVSLLTGLETHQVTNVPLSAPPTKRRQSSVWFEIVGDIVHFCRDIGLTKYDLHQDDYKLLGEEPGAIRVALPVEVARAFIELRSEGQSADITEDGIQSAFDALMQSVGRKQTLRRMRSVIRDRMIASGRDPVIAGHFAGETAQNLPSLYYTTTDNADVEGVYREVVNALPGQSFTWPTMAAHPVGSRLNVLQEKTRSFFQLVEQELADVTPRTSEQIVNFHNSYVSLVVASLMLMTGHRPVRQPFETLSDYDERRRWLYVSDKEVRSTVAGRFVPVPPIFVEQLTAWKAHLNAVAVQLGLEHHAILHAIAGAHSGEGVLFFYLVATEHQNEYEVQSITPKTLLNVLREEYWPLPLNWGRHAERTLLANISSDLSDAFMGHANPGAEAFAPHSGMGYHDMEALREQLTLQAEVLGIRVLKGLE
jgi:hypothetical protein